MKKRSTELIKVLVVSTLMAIWSAPAAASPMNCEMPPFVSTAAPCNVMIIMDNSASMNEVIYHSSYDPPDTTCDEDEEHCRAAIYETRRVTKNGREADLLWGPGDDGEGVRYSANYMDWIFSHATDEERFNLPQETRIQVARGVVSDIVKDMEDTIRFGLMKFNDGEGGRVVAEPGSNIDTYLDEIEATTCTPLAETLLETWFYFKGASKCYGGQEDGRRQSEYTSPIDHWCQKNFVIVVTDGEPTFDNLGLSPQYRVDWDGDNEDEVDPESEIYRYLDDIAWYMYHNDARDDLDGTQNVVTYTIGFNLAGWGAQLLLDTAENGHGKYLTASNASSLTDSLRQAIYDIIQRVSAGSAVAVLSTSEQDGDKLIRAKFMPGSWKGYVGAHDFPYDSSNSPLWEAGYLLKERNAGDRKVLTFHSGSQTLFDSSNTSLKTELSELWLVSTDEAANIIEYIRGTSDYEGTAYRERDGWKLGDIVHSTPVIIGPPTHCYTKDDYSFFRNANSKRKKVVYVGANDGMLHAFEMSDGKELWAYIPSNLWEKLKHLTDPEYCHEYFVDLSPKVVDVYDGSSWKTVLIGGERGGGKAYFAIDVTDPDNPRVLWEFDHENLGETWSIPAVGKVKTNSGDKWAAFVGSGFDNGTQGMFAIDVLNGELIWHGKVSDDVDNCLTSPTAIDTCGDGYIDTVYAGDLTGRLWRFDVSDKNDNKKWSQSVLFHAKKDSVGQPITARPVVSFDRDLNPAVYFGTGMFYSMADKTTHQQQSFYCIIDDGSGTTIPDTALSDQTDTPAAPASGQKGWYINLTSSSPSERVTSEAVVVAGVVLFTSFIPDDDPCAYGGSSYLWAVNYLTAESDALLEGPEDEDERKKALGQGIPSAPVVSLRNSQAVIQTSVATIHVENVKLPNLGVRLRSWREAIF